MHEGDIRRRDLIPSLVAEDYEIATRSGMRLHEADCHLTYARRYLSQNLRDQALHHYTIAAKMIDEMGYHRRDSEVAELRARLQGAPT